jgi:hypothetical protein
VVNQYSEKRAELPCGDRRLCLGKRTYVMAILNVTPDSFSDGGRAARVEDAVAHAERLLEEGADVIDIGGESTRPGAEPVARAALTRPLTSAERKNSVVIVHHDATQNFETHYRVLKPTTEASIEAAALVACRKIDPRYFAAKLVRHDPPKGAPVGPKYYFSCI